MQSAQFQLHASVEDSHWWFAGRRRIMQDLVRQVLPAAESSMVVDVGCGTGANLAALAGDYDCVGIDSSREAIELARCRFPGLSLPLRASARGSRRGDAGAPGLILLMDVLEHVPDDFAFLSGLLAASAPGTDFLVTVPANPSFWSATRREQRALSPLRHRSVPAVVGGAAGHDVLLLALQRAALSRRRAVRSWSRWRGRATGRAGTDVSLPIRPVNAGVAGDLRGRVPGPGGPPPTRRSPRGLSRPG